MNISVALLGNVILKSLTIFHSTLSGCGDNHCLCHPTELGHNGCAEMLNDDLDTLCNVRIMQLDKTGDLSLGVRCLAARIFLDFFIDLIEGVVSRIVLKHIENKAFLDSLLHRVNMECLTLAVRIDPSEQLQCGRLRCCGKREHRHIGLFAIASDLVGDYIFGIRFGDFHFTRTERHRHCRHIFARCGRMCFVDDYGKTLILQARNILHDVRELLNSGRYNLCVAVQGNSQISRIALVIHHADQTGLVLQSEDCFLQLTVNHDTVSYDDNIVEDDLVICIMKRGQPVSQPCDGVRFSRTGAVLDQVIL